MKKINSIAAFLTLAMFAVACNKKPHTTMHINNNGDHIKIEYAGRVIFNDDTTEIETIERGGYLKYNRNGTSIAVERDQNGKLIYQINDQGKKSMTDVNDKKILAEALREIAKNIRKRR
jgi:hypothetical protein